jgi:hypothetical protein
MLGEAILDLNFTVSTQGGNESDQHFA